MSKNMDFCHSWEVYLSNVQKKMIWYWKRTRCLQKKVVHKAVEAAGEFIGNKIADKIMQLKPVIYEKSINFEEIDIPPEKRQKIWNELREVL